MDGQDRQKHFVFLTVTVVRVQTGFSTDSRTLVSSQRRAVIGSVVDQPPAPLLQAILSLSILPKWRQREK